MYMLGGGRESRDDPGTVRVTEPWSCSGVRGYSDRGVLGGCRQSQDDPGTVRVTLAYGDTLTEGCWGVAGSPGMIPGLSELLWRTGIL